MKKFLKNAQGLTLVELLAVIVILGIIAAIAVPSIGGIIENSRENSDAETAVLIQNAAVLWATQQDPVPATVLVSVLADDGYLTVAPTDQTSDLPWGPVAVTLTVSATNGTITATAVEPVVTP